MRTRKSAKICENLQKTANLALFPFSLSLLIPVDFHVKRSLHWLLNHSRVDTEFPYRVSIVDMRLIAATLFADTVSDFALNCTKGVPLQEN